MVSQRDEPLVSGKQMTKNPQHIITKPKTPYDTNSLLLPAATNTELKIAVKVIASLSIDVAEFLTQVGNNSIA